MAPSIGEESFTSSDFLVKDLFYVILGLTSGLVLLIFLCGIWSVLGEKERCWHWWSLFHVTGEAAVVEPLLEGQIANPPPHYLEDLQTPPFFRQGVDEEGLTDLLETEDESDEWSGNEFALGSCVDDYLEDMWARPLRV